MKSKEIVNRKNGRLGAIRNLEISLKLPEFSMKTMKGIPGDPAYLTSDDYRAQTLEMDYQRTRARTEAQRKQFNR